MMKEKEVEEHGQVIISRYIMKKNPIIYRNNV